MKWTFINDRCLPEEAATLHFRDLAIQRGYGAFEFFKLADGLPLFLDEHLDRFYASASQLHLPVADERGTLKDKILTLIRKNGARTGGIRMTITGGDSPDGYTPSQPNLVMACQDFAPPTKEQFHRGIRLVSYEHQRQLPEVKSIDYLMAIWLQPTIRQAAADDVVYHRAGIISECPRSNFFIITRQEKLVTPATHILKGITRSKVIEAARTHMEVEERAVTLAEVAEATEIFITSTTKTVLPVAALDGHSYPLSRPFTGKIAAWLSSL